MNPQIIFFSTALTLCDNIQGIDKMLLSQNESSLTHFFTMNLNATPMLMHSFSTQQLNSYYLQEDSMNRYLEKLKMFFFLSLIHFSHFFIWLSICFCLFILFCYLLFVLMFQVFVTFYIWFCWLLVLL